MEAQVSREMPKYKCHKEVHALKIKELRVHPGPPNSAGSDTATIVPADEGFGSFDVDADYMRRHHPVAGGYYVVYKDGYKSFSPADAFEDGYTRL